MTEFLISSISNFFMDPNCIFCKIITGEIPSSCFYQSAKIFAFMDIAPLSEGHCLVIPKEHGAKLHQISDQSLGEILIILKKIALKMGYVDYNILQNNGRIAHQAVDHVHFHLIPKPNKNQGLGIIWNSDNTINQDSVFEKLQNEFN